MTPRATPPAVLRGLSLVELMVGLAVGLVVIALAIAAMARQAGASRSLLLDAQLTQELRAATDLLVRHVRRAGHWSEAAQGVWRPDRPAPAVSPHTLLSEAPDRLRFSYSSPAADTDVPLAANDHFGFRLRDGILDIELGEGRWQPLTDPALLRITRLVLTPREHDRPMPGGCPQACPATGADRVTTCPPRVRVRQVDVRVEAEATRHPEVHRQVVTQVRTRNDMLVGGCGP
jgi:prepilin peptidase dependent protein B